MKLRQFYTLAFILCFSFSYGQKVKTGYSYFKYPDKISSKYSYYKKLGNEVFHGKYISYFPNNSVYFEMEYENGKPIGERKEYYESGKVFMIIKTDSEGNSSLKKYFENGNLMEISSIINNEKEITKIGFENGNYVLYKGKNQLEYYNSSDELIKIIQKQEQNSLKINNTKKYYLDYPNLLLEYDKEGIVIVEFSIKKDGIISNLNIVESFDPIASEAVLKLIKNINPEDLKADIERDFTIPFEFIIN